jgi:hypothetical protein
VGMVFCEFCVNVSAPADLSWGSILSWTIISYSWSKLKCTPGNIWIAINLARKICVMLCSLRS